MALLSDEDIKQQLADADGWRREGVSIQKEFKFEDFKGSVDFVNRLTPIAEGMNHHPDLCISWNTVEVTISTHSEGGITLNDFQLANAIDAVA